MKNIKRSTSFTPDMLEQLNKLAAQRHISTSELIREFVEKGLGISTYETQIDFIRQHIHEELETILLPQVNRLAKLLVRIGIPTISGYYLLGDVLEAYVPLSKQRSFAESNEYSKKKAAVYLNTRDKSLDEIVKS